MFSVNIERIPEKIDSLRAGEAKYLLLLLTGRTEARGYRGARARKYQIKLLEHGLIEICDPTGLHPDVLGHRPWSSNMEKGVAIDNNRPA